MMRLSYLFIHAFTLYLQMYQGFALSLRRNLCCPTGYTGLMNYNDCNNFYHCINGNVASPIMDCGPGTLFDSNLQTCNWHYAFICQEDSCTSSLQTEPPSDSPSSQPSRQSSIFPSMSPTSISTQFPSASTPILDTPSDPSSFEPVHNLEPIPPSVISPTMILTDILNFSHINRELIETFRSFLTVF